VSSQNRHKGKFAKPAALLVASSLLIAAGAHAADAARSSPVLTAYSNGAGGEALLAGKYEAALAEIKHFRPQSQMASSAKANNLCVAYVAVKQMEQAKSACKLALRAAKQDKISGTRFAPGSSRENAYLAIAYANRAVAHLMASDPTTARQDLARAQSLAPQAEFVSKNMAALQSSRSTIAQLEVAPSR